MGKKSNEQLDEDEMKILAMLQKNSQRVIDSIARECGFTRQKVSRTIKTLEQRSIIWGYTAIIDSQKQDLQKFVLLLKRTNQPLGKEAADAIASGRLDESYMDLGVTIESGYYLHGEYDWVLIFTANDIRQAKKFSDLLIQNHPGVVEKANLMQVLFTQRDHYIFNPQPSLLKEFL